MKRGWTKSWLCASALAAAFLAGALPSAWSAQEPGRPRNVNEVTLAGLRPGKDTLTEADSRYKKKFRKTAEAGRQVWTDACRKRTLELEVNDKGVIQIITVSMLGPYGDCDGKLDDAMHTVQWRAGRGLKLGEPRDRAIDLYGEPNSSGPSTKGNRELELLYYAFDWAGSDVPQVMEVSCERSTGRIVEITLAFPSL